MKNMARRDFLKQAGLGLLAFPSLGERAASGFQALEKSPAGKPNILVIFTDDLDFDEVNALRPFTDTVLAGKQLTEKPPLTPSMDKLVNDSLLFTQFHVVCTVCTPSRYALLTGQYCSRSATLQQKHPVTGPANVEFNTDILPGQWHLARGLKDAGYVTGIVGKWHLTDVTKSDLVVRPPICEYNGKEHGPQDPTLPENAKRVREAYGRTVNYLRNVIGWDYVSSMYIANANQLGLPKPLWEHENNMEWFTAGVLKFLEQQKSSAKPFFLYFAPNVPHGGGGARFANADPRGTPEGLVDWHLGVQPTRDDVLQRARKAGVPNDMLWATWLDDGVGAILKKLDELDLAQNTIVLFSSDQQSRGKWTCYEGARVPLTVRWPGKIKPGTHNDALLASTDFVPALLELAGGKLPPADKAVIDGRSFTPLLTGGKLDERPVLIEMGYGRAIISGGWKYVAIRFPQNIEARAQQLGQRPDYVGKFQKKAIEGKDWPAFSDPDQLFNLRKDALEQNNLAADPACAAKLAEMRALLKATLAPLPHVFGEFKTVPSKQ